MDKVVIGIDASLTHTGISVVTVDNNERIATGTCAPKSKGAKRLIEHRDWLFNVLTRNSLYPRPCLAIMEGYAFTPIAGQAFSLGELGGVIKVLMREHDVKLVLVAPLTLKKWVTGEGRGDKNMILLKAFQKWKMEFNNDHECDAYGLARIGTAICNIDVKDLKQYQKYEQEVLKLTLKQFNTKGEE